MTHLRRAFAALMLLGAGTSNASASDGSECEIVLLTLVQNQAVTYLPATDFFKSLKDKNASHITEVDGEPIRIVMCRRNDVLPTKSDYTVMATGIPFVLSQDFDRQDTDSLTMYWKDGRFQHVYKGYPLSSEAEKILETRLSDFSKRGLNAAAAPKTDTP